MYTVIHNIVTENLFAFRVHASLRSFAVCANGFKNFEEKSLVVVFGIDVLQLLEQFY